MQANQTVPNAPSHGPKERHGRASTIVERSGIIVLDHRVEAIQVGHRHRRDLGDLTELIDSIREMGILQPITISPDGVLICGARRLAAVRQLGLRRINVWVRADISTPLQHLLAGQHDNTIRKPFSPAEAADIYAELRTLLAEEAARRQRATKFGVGIGAVHGAADSAAPHDRTSRPRPTADHRATVLNASGTGC